MSKIDYNKNIELAKSIDIKTIISKETKLKFTKNTLESCPFCDSGKRKGGTSAFSVKGNIFKCFSCYKKGGAIEFIKYYKGIINGKAIQYIVENYSNEKPMIIKKEVITDISKKIYAISTNEKSKATNYLEVERAIKCKDLPFDAYYYDKYTNAVVFFDINKQLINKRFIESEKGKSKSIFGTGSNTKNAIYDKLYNSKLDTVYIVEGVINSLSLIGFSSLSIFTTSNKFDNKTLLAKYIKNKNVVLAFDNDNAGQKCTNYYKDFIIENIEVESLSKLLLPEKQDINDLLKNNTLTKFLVDTDNYDYLKVDLLNKPLKKNDSKVSKYYSIKDSCYYTKTQKNGHQIDINISDCIFDFLYRLNDFEGTRLIKVQQTEIRSKNKIQLLELTSEQLKKDKFETELIKQGFSFFGSKHDLDQIRTHLQHKESTAEIIETFGQQKDYNIFAYSNCIINSKNELIYPNSLGMVQDKENIFYLPTSSPANENKLEDLKQFKYKKGTIDFKQFAELFYLSNKQNGSIGIQFYFLSLFRDIVFNSLDFFPYLYLYGEAGAGKTSYVDFLLGLFGDSSKGHGLKNISQAGLSRIASQKRNTITYYKEYSKEVPNFVEDYLKTGYDGTSRTISSKSTSKETISFGIESAGVIDSNFLPTNETAVFTRMIILDFENISFTGEQTKAYETLKGYEKTGLAQITKEVLKHREFFKDNFKDTYYYVLDELKTKKQLKKKFTLERMIKHIALILTPFHILSEKLNFPYDITTLENMIIEHAEAQEEKLHEFKSTNIFWQALAINRNDNRLIEFDGNNKEKAHYFKKPLLNNTGAIYLKTSKINFLYSLYAKHCKSIGMDNKNIDSFSELTSKLFSRGYFPYQQPPEKDKKRKGKNVWQFGYCYEFHYTIEQNRDSILIDNQEIEL